MKVRIIALEPRVNDFGVYIDGRPSIAFRGTLDECLRYRRAKQAER